MQGKSIVISAPSGAGKTSIVNFILAKIDSIEFSVSACNRPQRPAEVNGKNYHFLSTSDFREKIDNKTKYEITDFAGGIIFAESKLKTLNTLLKIEINLKKKNSF